MTKFIALVGTNSQRSTNRTLLQITNPEEIVLDNSKQEVYLSKA